MRKFNLFVIVACLAVMTCALPLGQAAADSPTARKPEVVHIWPGAAPGTEDWTGDEKDTFGPGNPFPVLVTNVTVPTLTVFRADPAKASGAAMIVAPGGGFQALAFSNEGIMVARWLAERGVTAFVLKYRVRFTPESDKQDSANREDFEKRNKAHETSAQIAAADGLQALRYVRANAAKYNINPDKVGLMGFSAGAMTTMRVVLNSSPDQRPNFAASIYGAKPADKLPSKDAPPVFIAAAQDDPQVPVHKSVEIFSAWSDAHVPTELHLYQSGGHGFGMDKRNKASDTWPVAFEGWLRGNGWITAAASAESRPAAASAYPQPAAAKGKYTTADTDVGTILDTPALRAIVDKYIPGFSTRSKIDQARPMTLKVIQQYSPDVVTDKALAQIDAEFANVK
jgi:acetyl esterase/lipase